LFLDNAPMKIGGVHKITGNKQKDLARHLGNAAKRPKLGAALLILDGDAENVEDKPFCAVQVARTIAQRAMAAGARWKEKRTRQQPGRYGWRAP
jgi:hypothetical protein